MRIGLIFLF